MRTNLIHLFIFLYLSSIYEVGASELTINLSNQKKAGTLMLAIYNNANDFESSVINEKRSEAGVFKGLELYLEPKESTQLKTEIPDGNYAIAFFIDVNGNKKLDKNFLGIPKEQFGFSNNAMGKLSAPSFEQAMFLIQDKAVQNIRLK